MARPVLHVSEILEWADKFHTRNRRWPNRHDGPVKDTIDVTWRGIDLALRNGGRGLIRNSSLPQLLQERRGVRNIMRLPRLTINKILQWSDAFFKRERHWPNTLSGAIVEMPGETWLGIDKALRKGRRGLPGNTSLGQFLAKYRKLRNRTNIPRLTVKQVLVWADAHQRRTGNWPTNKSGQVLEASEETWHAVDAALVADGRGLVGFGSLAQFLAKKRQVRNRGALPDLTINGILAWARDYYSIRGKWPNHIAGAIPNSGGETWGGVHSALIHGRRGLPRSTLYRVLRKLRRGNSKAPTICT